MRTPEEQEFFNARMCPECGEDSLVYDSREQFDGSIRRRRRCPACGTRFETVEKLSRVLHVERQGKKPVLS